MYPPPHTHPGMEKLKSQVKVTFWFWLMYPPPPGMKSWISDQHDILVLDDVPPPPRNGKDEISGQSDILVLDDVPFPPRNEKVGSQVKVTFWFWLMYPPPLIKINMNAIENNWGQQVLFTNQPPLPLSIILFYASTGNW